VTSITVNLGSVRARIEAAAAACGRDPAGIRLLAVSKTQPPEAIRQAAAAGCRDFGENYVREALPKLAALAGEGLCWHFIGRLQSNKTRAVATHFDWVHTVDRLPIAQRLSAQRSVHAPPLNLCIQVRIGAEGSKAGIDPQGLPALAEQVAVLPRVRLRGLMCIPPATESQAQQREYFAALRGLKERLENTGLMLDTLSMGMSADLESAVAEGATILRIGTAIFGPRQELP
jgi:pyridoxal phosphate enzyme (YggS family)